MAETFEVTNPAGVTITVNAKTDIHLRDGLVTCLEDLLTGNEEEDNAIRKALQKCEKNREIKLVSKPDPSQKQIDAEAEKLAKEKAEREAAQLEADKKKEAEEIALAEQQKQQSIDDLKGEIEDVTQDLADAVSARQEATGDAEQTAAQEKVDTLQGNLDALKAKLDSLEG